MPTVQQSCLLLLRAAAVLLALRIAGAGWSEARLALRCPSPVDLTGGDPAAAAALTESGPPLWARMEGTMAGRSPMVLATDTGSTQGAWLALESAEAPGLALAVIATDDLGYAKKLHAFRGRVQIEGVASVPGKDDSGRVRSYLGSLRLQRGPGFRLIEAGRRPEGLLASLAMILSGALTAAAAVLVSRLPFKLRIGRAQPLQEVHSLPSYQSPPLTDEVKVEVHHMLEEVWERASGTHSQAGRVAR